MIIEYLFSWVVGMLGVMVMMPYYSVMERKMMGYIQYRKGPKKVGLLGLFQPMGDGVKLLVKKHSFLVESKKFVFCLMPIFSFLMMLFFLMLKSGSKFFNYSVLVFLLMLSLKVIFFLGISWSSNSKYSSLGAMRMVNQIMGYDLSLLSGLLVILFIIMGCSMVDLKKYSGDNLMIMLFLLLGVVFVIEKNRIPFDFSEGESELVSGFKVEYGSLLFAVMSLSEYGSMMISSLMMGGFFKSMVFQMLGILVVMIFFLWIRGTFPRFRYDLLIEWCWMLFLPSMFIFMWVVFL